MNIEVVCFSYNRGALLQNLVSSIAYCLPCASITVFDDCSDDIETNRVIDALAAETVSVIKSEKIINSSHGGLHWNMKTFLERHARAEYVIFLQDDTQMIRRLEKLDLDCIKFFFESHLRTGFLYPMFSRVNRLRGTTPHKLSDGSGVWFRDDGHKYRGFSAICIFKPERLVKEGFSFGKSEIETSEMAFEKFGPMADMAAPIAAFMPAPSTVRFKKDTIVHRIWSRRNAGCFPISYLHPADVERMKNLFPHQKPLAADFLVSPTYSPGHPWPVFRMQRASWLVRWLDRTELRIRRLLGS